MKMKMKWEEKKKEKNTIIFQLNSLWKNLEKYGVHLLPNHLLLVLKCNLIMHVVEEKDG
jgi:hypothetical protein